MSRHNRSTPCAIPRVSRWTVGAGLFASILSTFAAVPEWPSWRGPSGQGSSSVTNSPVRCTVDSIAWKLPLAGKGTSSPVVSEGMAYLTSPVDGEDAVLCVDATGTVRWTTKLGPHSPPKHSSLASGCNASPAIDGSTLYVYFKSGTLAALNLDGSIRWKLNLSEKFGPERLYWDQGSSPVVIPDGLLVARMHQGESWIAAFNKKDGTIRWKVPRTFSAPSENDNGYATPVPFSDGNRRAFLIWAADHLTAHDERDGSVIWSVGGFNPEGTANWPAISTPVVANGYAIVPVGRDDRPNQAHIHAVRLGGTGDVSSTHRSWKRDDIGVFVTAPAATSDRVILLRHRGEVVCLEPTTGRTVWTGAFPKAASPYYASPVIAGEILYAAREDGVVFTARVNNAFELLSEYPMGERIIATPVPLPGRLLLRGDRHLICMTSK